MKILRSTKVILNQSRLPKQSKTTRTRIKLKKAERTDDPLEGIDFSDRYFKEEHHKAFRKDLWEDRKSSANIERHKAYDRFYELHREIFLKFNTNGLTDLDHHKMNRYIVSHYDHVDGFTSQQLSAMWLSYGKRKKVIEKYQELFSNASKHERDSERDSQSFINHARLQIILYYDSIGIWLFFGKRNEGSKFDRDNFRKEMVNKKYQKEIFDLFSSLPPEYYISLDSNSSSYINEFKDSESLHEYCRKDNLKNHFIIGRDYRIEDDEMSISRLPLTVLAEFKRLFPLYNKMRDKKFG